MNQIKKLLNKNFKPLLFCLIFALLCFLYNQNNQTLNFFLKRGSILEYSLNKELNFDKEKIEQKLIDKGIKYSFIKDSKTSDSNDFEYNQNENILFVALPYLAREDKTALFNDISDFVFENYPNSKLLSVKTLNDNYHKPYSAFLKFFGIAFVAFFFFAIFLYLFDKDKITFKQMKDNTKMFFKQKWDDFVLFLKKTKEKGAPYFFKKVFFDEAKDENGKEKEPDMIKEIVNTILFVVISVIAIRYFIGELRWIPSGSMRPTILEKDRVFVEKLDFPKREVKRGDILVFYPPFIVLKNDPWSLFSRLSGVLCKDLAFIKRVVGMPDDKFEIKYDEKTAQYAVYINDKPLDEPYISSKSDWTPCSSQMFCGPFIIPKGHYFMMGDNRGNSEDSRFWGFLGEDRIIGRANFMFFPIRRINVLKDKYLKLHQEKINGSYVDKNYIVNRYEFLYKI